MKLEAKQRLQAAPMKIKPEDYEHLKKAIAPLDTEELRKQYKDAGLSDKRYRWDLSYKANLTKFICDTLYPYMNDVHIDTALKSLVKPL